MKNKWRILKILVTVVLLGFLLSFSLKRFGNQKITDQKISVKLNEGKNPIYFVSENRIKELVRSDNPSGRIGDLKIPELEKKINAIPYVDSANVYMKLNGKLNLDIKQRVPVFRLINGEKDFYVDEKGIEFPTSKNYSFPCMLVTGSVKPTEYKKLGKLVDFINQDQFCSQYFIGISKDKTNYNLLTSEGNYKVEIGDLDNIEFKIKGFRTFVEKILVYQNSEKYNKISVKYNNQIVTTLNPNYQENDSILQVGSKELAKAPGLKEKKEETKTNIVKPASQNKAKSDKTVTKKTVSKNTNTTKTQQKTTKKTESKPKTEKVKQKNTTPKKAKIKIE